MARLFASASSQYLQTSSTPLVAAPVTLACWIKATTLVDGCAVSIGDGINATGDGFRLLAWSDGIVYAMTVQSAVFVYAATSTTYSTGSWVHVCATFESASSRAVFLNGGGKGTNTETKTPVNLDRAAIGRAVTPTGESYLNAAIAEAGIWDVALTDDEVLSLAQGASPLLVRPTALVGHWPLFGRATDEEDWVGTATMVTTGATVAADHPTAFYPSRRRTLVILGAGDQEALMELLFGQEAL